MDILTETMTVLGAHSPYVIVFLLLTLGIWISPFVEELALITAGYLIYIDTVQWGFMVSVASFGVFVGNAALFWLGRDGGKFSVPFRLFTVWRYEGRIDRVSLMLEQYGGWALFCVQFLPALRFPMHIAVGVSGMPILTYCKVTLLSIALYVPLLVTFAFACGAGIEDVLQLIDYGYPA